MSTTAWAVALECLERELESAEVVLATGGEADVDLDVLPAEARRELGPLPVELLERAAEVQARMARLEQAMVLSLHRARGSHALADRFGTGRDVPRFLDARG